MTIKQLPEDVASMIAAGEVVERPVSVVKELLENAIDACSTEIQIRIDQAGMKMIEVTDNGSGITGAEVRLALQRYATSKISDLIDLENIQSLGFRGEALASIAAVSRFTISTSNSNEQSGVELILEGGIEKSFSPIGFGKGTKIKVEDLFFNTPVRKKFLKKEITERRLISEFVSRYALFYSTIRIHMVSEGKETLLTTGSGDYKELLSKIFDLDTARRMLFIDHVDQEIEITGFTSPLDMTRSSRKDIFFFVNGRLISDATLTSAVIKAYQGLLMVARYPLTVLFIKIPPREIDVNVHPAKAEVRFENSGKIFSMIHTAVRRTVTLHSPHTQFSPTMWQSYSPAGKTTDPAWNCTGEASTVESTVLSNHASLGNETDSSEIIHLPILRPIGQIGRKYIISEGPDGIYLIDQHAAHERILFEKMYDSKKSEESSQLLLESEVIHLSPQFVELLDSNWSEMIEIGFQIQNFGQRSYRLEAIPALLQHMDPKEAIMSALEPDSEDDIIELEKKSRIISRICKKAAIKAGQVLTFQEQEKLVRDLENCQSPRTCPHGRPTMIHISVDVLERQFGRRGRR